MAKRGVSISSNGQLDLRFAHDDTMRAPHFYRKRKGIQSLCVNRIQDVSGRLAIIPKAANKYHNRRPGRVIIHTDSWMNIEHVVPRSR
jgi:hypothetical protein